MKATGIVRHIDTLGRIVIPKELRKTQGIKEGDPMEFYVDGKSIVLTKYNSGCAFCGKTDAVREVSGVLVCQNCAEKMLQLYEESDWA